MGYIYDTYLHNVTVHTGYGVAYGDRGRGEWFSCLS